MWFESQQWRQRIALQDQHQAITYQQLSEHVTLRRDWLAQQEVQRIALCMDNQIEWVLFDIACQALDICCVPVPSFFSAQQLDHLLVSSAIELLLCDNSMRPLIQNNQRLTPFEGIIGQRRYPNLVPQIPLGTTKITFTSGTTGSPKGVCLSTSSQLTVARSLVDAVGLDAPRHLCLLPLATLLENIAGVYAPLMRGGCVYLAQASERGFEGSRLMAPHAMLQLIDQQQPSSLILVPELLSVLIAASQNGWQPPTSLQFIAVGGAKVATQMIQQAHALGLPVYQGYGLSECASVVALNTPQSNAIGQVGKVLEHNQLCIKNHELVVTGNLFLGYLNQPESFYPSAFATGDLAELENGWLNIIGRQKNLIINSFGRNLSPEWIEAELLATQLFRHAVVFGEALPNCGAILEPASSIVEEEAIASAIRKVNQTLPDYARLHHWIISTAPFAQIPGLLTNTGKPIRANILAHYRSTIHSLYQPASIT